MAGDWIKIRVDLLDDPSLIQMAGDLELDEYSVAGRLFKAWAWANRHTEDGHATGVTPGWLDRYVDRDGFARAMEAAGWLETFPQEPSRGVYFPKFNRHNGRSAKERAQGALRAAEHRKRRREEKRREEGVTADPLRSRQPLPYEEVMEQWRDREGDLSTEERDELLRERGLK